jgi:hypothetical protein
MQKQVSIVAHWWFQYILVVTAERHFRYASARRNLRHHPAKDIFLKSLIFTSDQIHHSTNPGQAKRMNKKAPVALQPRGPV